jgi:preprotein translocase SecE subunit
VHPCSGVDEELLFGTMCRSAPEGAFLNMKNLISYLKNVKAELTHVVWPSRKVVLGHTILIVLLSAFTAVFIGVLDYLLTSGVGLIITK